MGALVRGVVIAMGLLMAGSVMAQRQKFSIHGYVNQAYAVSDEYPIFGIPTGGTTEYRDLALQFRFDPDRRNAVVVQLRHERLGANTPEAPPVELDWAFYQRNLSDRVTLKAGRIPLPLGIFNEAGGAAATSPFFRPPNEFYDRRYSSRTLEGILGSVTLGEAGGWSFEVDGYAGRWKLDQWASDERIDARNAAGAQVWANTPVEGVRIGAGAYRCDVEPAGREETDYLMLHASLDADYDRWRFAAEYLSGNLAPYGRYRTAYAQAGLQLTDRLSAHARGSVARIEMRGRYSDVEARISEDVGLSLNYSLHPSLLLKLEGHTNDGLLREDMPRNFYGRPSRTRYLIASVVASF